MKLKDPTIYVLHKDELGRWCKSAFAFTGEVDKRRVKREILKRFRKGGQTVSPAYIEASIEASLKTVLVPVTHEAIALPADEDIAEAQADVAAATD
ncbi:hypothetical protein [Rhizobium phage RHph_X3_9]|nr:hypothetical protein [Rhizobium phage RHph_X3_9]